MQIVGLLEHSPQAVLEKLNLIKSLARQNPVTHLSGALALHLVHHVFGVTLPGSYAAAGENLPYARVLAETIADLLETVTGLEQADGTGAGVYVPTDFVLREVVKKEGGAASEGEGEEESNLSERQALLELFPDECGILEQGSRPGSSALLARPGSGSLQNSAQSSFRGRQYRSRAFREGRFCGKQVVLAAEFRDMFYHEDKHVFSTRGNARTLCGSGGAPHKGGR